MKLKTIARKLVPIPLDKDICLVDLTCNAKTINEMLQSTECPYIAFTDVVDNSKKHYFNQLLKQLKNHPDLSLASGKFRKRKPLTFQQGLPEQTSILDAEGDYATGLLYPEGSICKTSIIRDHGLEFDTTLQYYRDELFSMQLSAICTRRLFVPERLFKPVREFDELFVSPPNSHEPEWYWELVKRVHDELKRQQGGTLKRQTQHSLVYLLLMCFKCNENAKVKMVFADVPETLEYFRCVSNMLQSIYLGVLFSRKRGTQWANPKLLFLAGLKSGENLDLRITPTEDNSDFNLHCIDGKQRALVQHFCATPLYIQNLDFKTAENGSTSFHIFARFPSCFPVGSFELHLTNTYGEIEHDHPLLQTRILSSCTTFFDQKAHDTVLWDVNVPLAEKAAEQTIAAYAIVNGKRIPIRIAMLDKSTNRLRDDCPEAYWSIPNYLVRALHGCIVLEPATLDDKAMAEQQYCEALDGGDARDQEAARIRRLYWQTLPEFREKRIWVYFDKAFKAGDNAEFLIRHAIAQNDGIEHVFYIDPSSADAERLRQEGIRIMEPRSDEGMLYLLNAEVVFATHVPAYRIPGIKDRDMHYYKDLVNAKNIRLYHGFTLTHDCSYSQPFMNSCGVAVSSSYEHNLYAEDVHGFAQDQIIDSGMPRHDGVIANNKRWILFAPTWRPTLRGGVGPNGNTLYNPDFVNSRYFQRYNTILTDERLLECARRCNYKIKLYLHPRMAPMTIDFESNDVFEAIDCTQGTEYADIMSKSDLMVTDYSSVMIDFAYARKPVVYYQDPALPYWRYFDFDYRNLGFGEVVESTDQVVELLCDYMQNECTLKDEYRKRIDDFFYFDDQRNSERLYNTVRTMLG